MKRSFSLSVLTLALLVGLVHAQVPAYVAARIDQVGARIANPTAFDSLFTAEFLSHVSAAQLAPIFIDIASQYGASTRWYLTDSSGKTAVQGRYVLERGPEVYFAIDVDPEPPHRIQGLRFLGVSPLVPTLDSVVARIRALPGRAGIQIAEVNVVRSSPTGTPANRDAGVYVPVGPDAITSVVRSANADSLFALGSSFKLWVLSALIHKIETGKARWSDAIALDSASLSLPSGILQNWPVGSPLTLATVATEMISISDNTATDLLIHWLGRDVVEEAMLATGSTHLNANNRPFLTTLEMFKLKSNGATRAREYLKLSAHNRADYLSRVVDTMSRERVQPYAEPTMIDKVEWFATPNEMAKALAWIKDHTDSTSATRLGRQILAVNPGVHIDRRVWRYAGYKGGSEPGVISMNYLLESVSGQWFTITAAWNNAQANLDEDKFVGLIERAIELLGDPTRWH